MEMRIMENVREAGYLCARKAADILKDCVEKNGCARFMIATGQSQFEFYNAILKMDVPWEKIEIFHLDEYVGLDETHPASFVGYIKERFARYIKPLAIHYIEGTRELGPMLAELNRLALEKPVDVVMIGFGLNAHIAFNDPPADFEAADPYRVVTLEERCKLQQVGEGWFPTVDDVPRQAVSASVHFIRSCRNIVSLIPYKVKAPAVKAVLEAREPTPDIPGTAIKDHPNWFLYLDREAASLLDMSKIVV